MAALLYPTINLSITDMNGLPQLVQFASSNGQEQTARKNIAAIEILKTLDAENRIATPGECAQIRSTARVDLVPP